MVPLAEIVWPSHIMSSVWTEQCRCFYTSQTLSLHLFSCSEFISSLPLIVRSLMWCWQVKDVNVANTNEAGSLQRSIKSMCYKSCELLPTMIAAGMKWLQHSRHSPAQKFSTLHLLRPEVCQTAKFTAGRCPEQAMSISPHQQQIQRGETCISNMLAQEPSSSFSVRCSDVINNAILWAVHPVSLSHQARDARCNPGWLIGWLLSMLASDWSMWPPASPLSHLSPASLQLLLLSSDYCDSELGLTSVWLWADSSLSLGRCLCLEMSELVKFSPHCFQAINCISNKSQLKQSAPCLKIRNFQSSKTGTCQPEMCFLWIIHKQISEPCIGCA